MKHPKPTQEDIAYAIAYAQVAIQLACAGRTEDAMRLLSELEAHIILNSGPEFNEIVERKLHDIFATHTIHKSLVNERPRTLQN